PWCRASNKLHRALWCCMDSSDSESTRASSWQPYYSFEMAFIPKLPESGVERDYVMSFLQSLCSRMRTSNWVFRFDHHGVLQFQEQQPDPREGLILSTPEATYNQLRNTLLALGLSPDPPPFQPLDATAPNAVQPFRIRQEHMSQRMARLLRKL